MIYFVLDEGDRRVKIGKSDDPQRRLRQLLIGSSVELRLLKVIPGSFPEETALRWRFSEHRVRGDWFAYEPIKADIEAMTCVDMSEFKLSKHGKRSVLVTQCPDCGAQRELDIKHRDSMGRPCRRCSALRGLSAMDPEKVRKTQLQPGWSRLTTPYARNDQAALVRRVNRSMAIAQAHALCIVCKEPLPVLERKAYRKLKGGYAAERKCELCSHDGGRWGGSRPAGFVETNEGARRLRELPDSDAQVAQKLGVTAGAVRLWRIGARCPWPALRVAMTTAYGISPKLWVTPEGACAT